MEKIQLFALLVLLSVFTYGQAQESNAPFSLEAIKYYPFPDELTTAATGSRIAWAFNEGGQRNIYVAEGPDFRARRLTNYTTDDGQALSSVSLSADGNWVVCIHGDDDRNVRFSESTDLVRRLEEAGVDHETLVIVDDMHHFMLHANSIRVNKATAAFFTRKLLNRKK